MSEKSPIDKVMDYLVDNNISFTEESLVICRNQTLDEVEKIIDEQKIRCATKSCDSILCINVIEEEIKNLKSNSQGANSSGEYDLVSQDSRPKDSIKSETNQFVNRKRCAPDIHSKDKVGAE